MPVSEGGATWVPFIADRMEEGYRQHAMILRPKVSRIRREIIYSQVYAWFQHDSSAVVGVTAMGFNNVLWGSHYSHIEGTFGHVDEKTTGEAEQTPPVTSAASLVERTPVSTVSSTPETVTFSGAGGISLVADEWNRGSAASAGHPTVLMLHGGGQNRFSWKNTGQILAEQGFHVVALDSRGHGDSDRAPGADYAVETLTADVMHVLDAIGRPVVVIGASMGGLTGILVAHRAGPDKVTRLVLVDVVPRFEKRGSARIRDFMVNHIHGFSSLEEAADAVAAYLPHRKRPRNPEGLKKNLRLRDGRWYWHWDPAFMTKPGDDPQLRTEKFEQAAAELKIPVLLIRGKLSDVVSLEGVQHFLVTVPNAEFVELSDAGHTAAGDDNDAFSDAVVAFVNR